MIHKVYVNVDGKRLTLRQFGALRGISYSGASSAYRRGRLATAGSGNNSHKKVPCKGGGIEFKCIADAARHFGFSPDAIRYIRSVGKNEYGGVMFEWH